MRGIRRIAGAVVKLSRVGLEIEEEGGQGIKVHIFVPGVLDHREPALIDVQIQHVLAHAPERAAKVELIMDFCAPVCWCSTVEEGYERPAVTGAWHLSAYPI